MIHHDDNDDDKLWWHFNSTANSPNSPATCSFKLDSHQMLQLLVKTQTFALTSAWWTQKPAMEKFHSHIINNAVNSGIENRNRFCSSWTAKTRWATRMQNWSKSACVYFCRLIYNSTTHTSDAPPGVEVRVPGFGKTYSLEYLDPSKRSVGEWKMPGRDLWAAPTWEPWTSTKLK